MATIKEISQLASVSSTTVSRVLNQDDTIVVSPEVRKKIFKIAHELNYVPPRMRHAQKEKEIVIGVADWHIIRKDRPNIRISSLDCIAKTMAEKTLATRFGRKVHIINGRKKGKIELEYYNPEDLNTLLELLEQLPSAGKGGGSL